MPKAVILLSGGMDSAVCLALAKRDGFEPHALTVDYGQRHVVEIARSRALAESFGVASHAVCKIDLSAVCASALTGHEPVPKSAFIGMAALVAAGQDVEAQRSIPATYVPARNTVLLSLALARAETVAAEAIFFGANCIDFSGYPDCRPEFVRAYQALADFATKSAVEGHRIRIEAPLLLMTKADIVRLALELNVDLALATSCYDPDADGKPCGACDACIIRADAFQQVGIEDPQLLRVPNDWL